MGTYDANIAKINIVNYFRKCGLTIDAFANIIGISDRWFKSVSSLKNDYVFDVDTVIKAASFFSVEFRKFTSSTCVPPDNLRELLQKKHAKNLEFSKALNDTPSLPFIIDNILIHDANFLNEPELELKHIKAIIRTYYPKINFSNLSITIQNSGFIKHWPHPTKKNTNLYAKK
ncbi:hypothetical protein [Sphingobacterium faecale]|uniref:XRE family transcriptional regulator n=1 Tax=Sphingobacterium faecale TaxID=2803775 RepID=A0ABS1R937_9SPHI|nr:hypothetical protein [Sphingobacterium faecale]MBL1411223.1 hypothetical protein [Sphingobacterium faecale]